jgi:23S rRNA pseudouridine1911/1915/1917 synthase
MQEFKANPAEAGIRADIFVAAQYPNFTRSALSALFDQNLVKINDQPAKPALKIKAGDNVQVDETLLKVEPPAINLPVIYEDENSIVIDKPAGILTHSKGALNLEGTVASFIADKLDDPLLSGNRAGIVHRLDRGTSGVIIAARNSKALGHLQKQFSLRKVKKSYLAAVEGVPEPAEAVIDVPIARNPKRPQTFTASIAGRPAVTHYKVLKTLAKGNSVISIVELKPLTGRTHQLRVHLAYVGHPIIGDKVYGHGGEYLMLHAQSLEITLPGGLRKIFSVDPPQAFNEYLNND